MLHALWGMGALGVVAALLVEAPAIASAQPVEAAREHWFEADFEASRTEFEAVLANPRSTPLELLDAHRYLAALHLVLGDDASARLHADAAVALDPHVQPPDGSPPAVVDLFRMARRRAEGRTAHLVLSTSTAPTLGVPTLVIAELRSAPPHLVAGLRLRCGEASADGPPPTLRLTVTPTQPLRCSAEATADSGAALFRTREDFTVTTPRRRALPWILGAAAIGAAVILTVVAVMVTRRPGNAQIVGTTVVGW